MRTFSTTIDIAAPADQVWEVMSDTDRWHEWTPSITSVKRIGDGRISGGLFGRITRDITERYLGFEANGLKARSKNPGFRIEAGNA